MRPVVLFVFLARVAFGQSLVEAGAAAAGGSVGGVAGKKVSDSLTSIFEKVDKQTAKAAQGEKPRAAAKAAPVVVDKTPPLLTAGPGMVKRPESVPPPPPIPHAAVHRPAPVAPPVVVEEPVPPPPPPPEVTAADLKTLKPGMNRENLLELGAPASRITMFDEGHLLEVYRYSAKETTLGVVRLSDGRVSAIDVR